MNYKISGQRWFVIFERTWRPFQGWGFAIAAVAYAMRPVIGLSFVVETFAALATASGAGFITRAVEKHKNRETEQ